LQRSRTAIGSSGPPQHFGLRRNVDQVLPRATKGDCAARCFGAVCASGFNSCGDAGRASPGLCAHGRRNQNEKKQQPNPDFFNMCKHRRSLQRRLNPWKFYTTYPLHSKWAPAELYRRTVDNGSAGGLPGVTHLSSPDRCRRQKIAVRGSQL